MRIKYSDLSNTSKFLSKYLNSVAAFLGQVPLNGTGTIAIKEKYRKKKKVGKFAGLDLPAGQNKANNFIANRCQ